LIHVFAERVTVRERAQRKTWVRLIRPRARYVGEKDAEWVPIDER